MAAAGEVSLEAMAGAAVPRINQLRRSLYLRLDLWIFKTWRWKSCGFKQSHSRMCFRFLLSTWQLLVGLNQSDKILLEEVSN